MQLLIGTHLASNEPAYFTAYDNRPRWDTSYRNRYLIKGPMIRRGLPLAGDQLVEAYTPSMRS